MASKPVILAVLDGYGVNPKATESTWRQAARPNFQFIEKFYPFTTLQASGAAVGLPWGEEGNSEVGHLTMGAGRVLYTHLPRIIMAIRDGSFFQNQAFQKAVSHVKKNNSRLHLLGLFSSGSVHAYADHIYALLELARKNEITEVFLHLFTDGRDAPAREAAKFFASLEARLAQDYPTFKIASVVGRHFVMDRDNHWDLIERAYNLLVLAKGDPYESASLHIEKNYKKNLTDEFVEAGFLTENGKAVGRIQNGDSAIFFNYREDSVRELTGAFVNESFDKFPRQKITDLLFTTMTEYDRGFAAEVAFKPLNIENPLAKIISDAGLKQLHIAETEKYAHVTYFFNGGQERPFKNEERILAPSLQTPHFDEHPEMSAALISDQIISSLNKYDFILANFANADMVGHSGSFESTVKALEALDDAVGKIMPAILEAGGVLVLTGDHGNAEEKHYRLSGEKRTKHTTNPVPFYIVSQKFKRERKREDENILKNYSEIRGTLTDIAPTILELLNLKAPPEMTGVSLLPKLLN